MWSKSAVLASIALAVVIVCATGAFGTLGDFDDSPWSWCHGEAKLAVKADGPARKSSQNDAICTKSCKGTHPRYKKGNWGLFSRDGLMCCCATVNLGFRSKYRDYYETTPHISGKAMAGARLMPNDPRQD